MLFWSLSPLYSWGIAIMSSSALPSTFAMGIAIWGIYFALKDRWILSYGLFGLAAILQFLVGFLPGLVFGPAFLRDMFTRRNWGQVLPAMILWGAGLAVVYLPMLLTSQPAPADFDFVAIFGQYRFPHHWIPSSANAIEWLSDTALVISTLTFTWSLRKSTPAIRRLALLCSSGLLVSTLAVIVNYLFVEVWPVTMIGKLQFQRIMPFGHLCAMISSLMVSVALWQKRQYGSLAALIIAPLFMLWGLIVAVVVTAFLANKAIGRTGQTALLLLLLVISPVLHTVWHVVKGNSVIGAGFSTSIMEAVSYLILLVSLIGIAAFISLRNGLFRNTSIAVGLFSLYTMIWLLFNIQAFQKNDIWICDKVCFEKMTTMASKRWSLNKMSNLPLASLAEALRVHTEPNQVVMLPPCGPFEYFQLISQRPSYFVHLNVPFTDYGVWLWGERGAKLLGNKLQPFMTEKKIAFLFSQRSSYELASLAQKEGISYVVSRKDWHGDMPGTLLYEDTYGKDIWALWRLYRSQSHSGEKIISKAPQPI